MNRSSLILRLALTVWLSSSAAPVVMAQTIPMIPAADSHSFSPLAEAAMRREMGQVITLLSTDNKPDVDAFGSQGTAALHWVVRYGDAATLEWLLGAGADVNLPNQFGQRPLQLAIANGHPALVQRLLEAGADPGAPDLAGEPPLFLAAALGDLASIEYLLAAGAAVDGSDPMQGQTALMVAARSGQHAAVAALLAAGADVNRQALTTSTAAGDEDFLPPSIIPGTLTQGVGIIRGGWPEHGIRQPQAGAKTALLYATRLGDLALVQQLVAAGADLEQADANGITPLLNAIINTSIVAIRQDLGEHLQTARYLLEAGAKVNSADWYGQTPLWAAVDVRNLIYRDVSSTANHIDRPLALTLIRELLAAGADPNQRTKEFPPSRHFILSIGSVEWVDMTGQTPFLRAALAGDLSVMELLLEHGADPNIPTFTGTTALMVAAGVNWAVGQTYDEGEAQLLAAVRLTHRLGNDINAVNSMGLQAIHGAANRGSNSIIRYLADNGAELDRPDKEGRTPIRWAEGEYLPSRPLVHKPETIALLRAYQQQRGE